MVEEDVLEESTSIQVIAKLLKKKLRNLDIDMFENRYLTVVRVSGMMMANHAKGKSPFRGPESEIFFSILVDTLSGIFTAKVSAQTHDALSKLKLTY
jgi:hypothetical protein